MQLPLAELASRSIYQRRETTSTKRFIAKSSQEIRFNVDLRLRFPWTQINSTPWICHLIEREGGREGATRFDKSAAASSEGFRLDSSLEINAPYG